MIVLKKQNVSLTFEWDNWFEGTVEGPEALLQEIRAKYAPQCSVFFKNRPSFG